MYKMYLKKILVPVMPKEIKLKVGNRNKTVDLANDGEVNLFKSPGLTEIEFELMIPNVKHPFATYSHGFKRAYYYIEYIERLKLENKPFSFIVYRNLPSGKNLFQTAMKVTLEEYTLEETADEGFDVLIKIKLKQWKNYGTKVAKIKKSGTGQTISGKLGRPQKEIKLPTTHKVTKKDTIWTIAKKYYGDELKYYSIWQANKKLLKNPEDLKAGMKLKIPKMGATVKKLGNPKKQV